MLRRFLTLILFYLIAAIPLPASAQSIIEGFSPQGTVKNVRQVKARFTEPMVAFGDPRLADPFDINCPLKGQGRWIDARNWSYDFPHDLPAGVVCEFKAISDLKSLKGTRITGQKTFLFSTGGPSVKSANPWEGRDDIDERQIFVLTLDAVPDESSILKNVYFSVEGIKERVGITLISGKERSEILKALHYKEKDEKTILIQAKQTFPAEAAVKLVWAAGTATKSGVVSDADQTLSYRVRSPFKAEFSCGREKADAGCIPVLPMSLYFTAQVAENTAHQILIKSASGKIWKAKRKTEDADCSGGDCGTGEGKYTRRLVFEGPFPEKTSFHVVMPKDIRDDAGRTLENAAKFPLAIKTDSYPPLAKFSGDFGIIEAKGDLLLPVTVRNIEADIQNRLLKIKPDKDTPATPDELSTAAESLKAKPAKGKKSRIDQKLEGKVRKIDISQEDRIISWLNRSANAKREQSVLKTDREARQITLPKPGGAKAFEVLGIPLEGPGFYVVELESRILGEHLLEKPGTMYVHTAALVTNLSAHFKWGRESSLVWVTSLDKGLPVKDAAVTLRACNGAKVWQGKTDALGVARIKSGLPSFDKLPRCEKSSYEVGNLQDGLFVFARTKDDMTFSHSSWDRGIEPWRFQLPDSYISGEDSIIAHSVFDRKLLRAGETISMKHFMRVHTGGGFALIPPEKRPGEVLIEHRGTQQQYRTPVVWGAGGAAENTWKIPEDAKLGVYDVTLILGKDKKKKQTHNEAQWHTGFFKVEEFRVPLMKGTIQPPAEPLVRARDAYVDLSVSYLSGGGASSLPVKLRAEIVNKVISFSDYDEFSFAGGRLKEGIISQSEYRDYDVEAGDDIEAQSADLSSGKPVRLKTQELQLGEAGSTRARFDNLPRIDAPRDILTELEYRDPNGEVQTAAARVPLYPAKLHVGISPDSWALSKDALKYRVLVLDLKGKPVPNAEVAVDIYQRKTYSHRVRLVGGFYSYKSRTEIKKIGRHFTGRTNRQGILLCDARASASGSVILHAEVKDEDGGVASANSTVWIAGREDWWFDARNDDRIDLLPEKKRYEPGETARLQVRMPFREATALVAVEREGIVDVFTKKLSGKMPVIEVPVKNNYAPNVYISALVVRGRIGGTKPTATFDPGKPSYKLGITEINVGWKAHELKVQVIPDRTVYKVREMMNVGFRVKTASGAPPPKNSEIAVAAVDKGLLLLMPNDSWKLLDAMMGRRGYEVKTATAQTMVVGKRHFGLKAVAHGGGGGKQMTRELFDTLLLWKGRVKLDEHGEASVKIPLNDSLTGFRIVAIASGGSGLFGTGDADVRTTQDLMLMSGIPPLVREGDKYKAGFTVRNTSDRKLDIELKLTAGGDRSRDAYDIIRTSLDPGSAKEIGWQITVPHGVDKMTYEIDARETAGTAADHLRVTQKVAKAVPVRTYQATLSRITDKFSLPVEKPHDALPGRGGVSLQLKPSIASGLGSVREYMELYPYICLEQIVSKAVALRDAAMWNAIVQKLPSYMDADGLLKYFPLMITGSDVLTSYVLSVSNEAGYGLPKHLSSKLIRGLKNFVEGRIIRRGVLPTADLSIRKLSAVEAVSRYEQVNPSLLSPIAVEPNLWPTSAVVDWINVLTRIPQIPQRDQRLRDAQHILRSRMNMQGTTMGFSTESMDRLWWLMTSGDVNAARALLTVIPMNSWNEDTPLMARGTLGRMKRGHWDTTNANAWGVLAMEKFSAKFEATRVTGTTEAVLNKQKKSIDWRTHATGTTFMFNWPKGKDELAVSHKGAGVPWAIARSMAAIPLKQPFSSGYKIKKTIIPVDQKAKGEWHRGDIIKVRLDMESQADMTWVVMNDPIPSGSSIIRTDIGGGSGILTAREEKKGWAWEAYTEKSFEAYRIYYEYVPKGKWTVEYTLRLNNEGSFNLPATRVEALYAPEMLGEIPNRGMNIRE